MVTTPLLPQQNQAAPANFPLAQPLAAYLAPYLTPYDPLANVTDLGWALATFAARRDRYALYDQYVAGIHRPLVATQAYEATFRSLLARTAANVCPAVVRALTDRLKLTGFSPHSNSGDEKSAEAAWSFYQDRRLARVANYAHGRAATLGDAALVVWPDKTGRARLYAHGGDAVAARYDDEEPDLPNLGARLWQDGDRYRLTLYYADRVERYATNESTHTLPSSADAFTPYREDGEPWPVRNPWGRVPVFPLAFEGGPGLCGRSVLTEVVPLQDQLNKAVIDRAVAQEFGAWPQRWAVGLEPDYDENGKPLPFPLMMGINRLLTAANPETKFGAFNATDMGPYTETIMSFLDLIATVTGIPPHLLHRGIGTPPSGEALKTAEARLVARVEDTQTDFGDVWEDAISFALTVEGTPGGHFVADWRPAVTRAELEHAQTVGILRTQVGIPLEEGLKMLDYTEEQVREIVGLSRSEQAFAADLGAGDGSATLAAQLGNGNGGGQ